MILQKGTDIMLLDLLRDGFSLELVVNLCASLFVMFCVLPIHEFAHAFVSTRLGDHTARLSGRLTINPLAHLDPIGALLILVAGFGYAKPVPVNPRNFKNPRGGMALTAVAGPVSNLIMSFLFVLCFCAVYKFADAPDGSFPYAIATFFMYAAQINISLAVFNLLPVPPLDGSRILSLLLPRRYYFKIMQYERYIVYAVLFLVVTGVLDTPITLLSSFFIRLFVNIGASIFGLQFNM